MAPFVLKFKGNKSFSPLGQISDSDTLTKTWKVCTKVAQHLEQGQRLENLSWRLWFLQFALVQADNAKSKREFKKLGKHMSDKLDKDKNRSIAELEAPYFKRTDSTEKVRARVEEMERNREHGKPFSTNPQNGMRTMQYTFALDPNVKPLHTLTPSTHHNNEDHSMRVVAPHRPKSHKHSNKHQHQHHDATPMDVTHDASSSHHSQARASQQLSFPTIFSSDLGPTALLCPAPTTSTRMSYGEAAFSLKANESPSTSFAISRPTFEFPIDEFLKGEASEWGMDASTAPPMSEPNTVPMDMQMQALEQPQVQQQGQPQQTIQPTATSSKWATSVTVQPTDVHPVSSSLPIVREDQVMGPPPVPASVAATSTSTVNPPATKAAARQGPSATPPTRNNTSSHNPGNSAPGGVKSECANCGATHTPLWRRGLNDELNCNACGLYCKLHKRARPKNLRASHGERSGTAWAKSTGANGATGGVVGVEGATTADVVGDPVQCHNCATMATPLWRKDDEGNTLCNACGLYLKLHGTKRPLSMKSDVIRKRSRHESEKRSSGSGSGSAGVLGGGSTPVNALNSRRTSPTPPPPSASPTSPSETFTTPAIGPNSLDGIAFPFSADFNFSYNTRDEYNTAGANDAASNGTANLLGEMFGSGGFGTSYSNMLAYGPEPNQPPASAFSATSTLSNSLTKTNHFNHYRSNSNATASSQATFQFSPPLRPFEEDVSDHYHSEESSIRKKRRLTAESSFSGSSLAHTTGGRTSANSSPTSGLGAINDLGSLNLGSQISPQSPPYFSLDFIQYQNQSGAQQQQPQQRSSSSSSQDGNGNVVPGVTHDYYGFPLHPPMAPLHPPSLVSPYASGTHDVSQMMPLYLDESGGEAANAATPTGSGEFHHALQRRASQHQQTHHYQYHVMPKEEEMYVHTDMFADTNGGQQQGAAEAGGSMHSHIHYQQGSM